MAPATSTVIRFPLERCRAVEPVEQRPYAVLTRTPELAIITALIGAYGRSEEGKAVLFDAGVVLREMAKIGGDEATLDAAKFFDGLLARAKLLRRTRKAAKHECRANRRDAQGSGGIV